VITAVQDHPYRPSSCLRRNDEGAAATVDRLEYAAADLVGTVAMAVFVFRLATGGSIVEALGATLAVLVVAVPCVLRMATRLPRMIGTERAARLGVLISGADALTTARHVDTVVLAGASTLTNGDLAVRAVHAADGVESVEVLRLAGAVAQESDRPIDRAIAAATPRLPGVAEFDPVDDLGARGIVAEVVGAPGEEQRVIAHAVLVGDAELLAAHDIDPPAQPTTTGCVPVAVAWDGVARGVLEVGPSVAPATSAAVRGLRNLGVRPVLMAAEPAPLAQAVAASAGLAPDAVLAGVTAGEAAPLVRELRPTVAVIAESARYGAALDVADLAIPLTPSTGEDHRPAFTLEHGDLATAVDAIRIARHTAAVTRTNLICSLACVAVLLPVTAAGLLGPALSAALTAACAAVLAINSLRRQRRAATDG
jgi:cation transport ATPase